MIHASARAIERLRWPLYGPVEYRAAVGDAACGAPATRKWFRAEDARALLQGQRTSTLFEGEENRRYVMPDCPRCAVLVDQALSAPFVIHFVRYSERPGPLVLAECGARPSANAPRFGAEHLRRAKNGDMNQHIYKPTCSECLKSVEKELYGSFSNYRYTVGKGG